LANRFSRLAFFLATVLAAVFVGAFRAWLAADTRAREYEADTELQHGLADALRAGREVRRRVAATPQPNLQHVEPHVWSWVWTASTALVAFSPIVVA
jgi:hypothetical protein